MRHVHTFLLVVAFAAGGYSLTMWTFGDLHSAGIAGAISAAAIVVDGLITHCGRQSRHRMRRGRDAVWQRRIDEARW
jgi:hypothetical protein